MKPTFALFVVLAALLCAPAVYAQQYTITDLGTFSGTSSYGESVNNAGQVAGIYYTAAGVPQAFLYSNGTMTSLGTLGGSMSQAHGINTSGQVAGTADTGSGAEHAFLYSNGTMTDLGTLGGYSSTGGALNDSGQVTGQAGTNNLSSDAYLYSNGRMTDLGNLGSSISYGEAINSSGQVTGASNLTNSGSTIYHAFLYNGQQMIDLGTLGGSNSIGYGINTSGFVTGTAQNGSAQFRAFLYSNGQMKDIGTLGGASSSGNSINTSQQIVGAADTTSGTDAFLYNASLGMQDLNSLIPANSGWVLQNAQSISDNGNITGSGTINGSTHAFLLTPVSSGVSVTSLTPSSRAAGSGAFTISVIGMGFAPSSVVQWDGTGLTTTFASVNKVYASVPAALIASPGTASIAVATPGAVTSNSKTFTITAASGTLVPVSLTFTPNPVADGNTSYGTITLSGAAPSGGAAVALTADGMNLGSISVPEGQSSTTFGLDLDPVGHSSMQVVATLNGTSVGTTLVVDGIAPTTKASLSGTVGKSGWYRSAVQVTLSAADDSGGSGVANTYYTVDGGAQQTYSAPFTLAGDGTHTVTFFSVDQVGNTESKKSQTIKIDATPPVTTASVSGTTVTLSAHDATSGVAGTVYSIDGGAQTTYTGPFTVTGTGTHTVTFASTDVAGNTESTKSQKVTAAPAPALSSLVLTPPSVTAGQTSSGKVTLSSTAPAGGATVTLKSSDTSVATVPSSETIAQGNKTYTFAIATKSVTSAKTVTITATIGSSTKTATLTVTPSTAGVTVSSLTLSPTSVKGDSATSTGTITLSGPAPTGGLAVTQTSSNTSAATLAGTLNIAAGATSAKFKITTYAVSSTQTVTITSSANGASKTATLTVTH